MSKQPGLNSNKTNKDNRDGFVETNSTVDNSQETEIPLMLEDLETEIPEKIRQISVNSSSTSKSSTSKTDEVYTTRYSAHKGEASPYEQRFDPNYLIVADERKVFDSGVDYLSESSKSIKQLGAINQKVLAWGKLALQGDIKELEDKLARSVDDVQSGSEIYQKIKQNIVKCYPDKAQEIWGRGDVSEDIAKARLKTALPDLKLLNDREVDKIDAKIIASYHRKEPLVITALDFGSGDGRGIELWQGLADRLKESGITLRVKTYDVIEAGLETYASRLTNPILPKKYSNSLKKHYGEAAFQERLMNSYVLDAEDKRIVEDARNAEHEEGFRSVSLEGIAKKKEQYGERIYQEKLERGALPTVKDLVYLNEKYGFEMQGDGLDVELRSPENVKALKKMYGEYFYNERKDEQVSLSSQSDAKVLKGQIGEEAFWKKANDTVYEMSKEDAGALKRFYGARFIKDRLGERSFPSTEDEVDLAKHYGANAYQKRQNRIDQLDVTNVTTDELEIIQSCKRSFTDVADKDHLFSLTDADILMLKKIYQEEDYKVLKNKYGEEEYAQKSKQELNVDFKGILGAESYACNVEKDGFPTLDDYAELQKVYGDKEITALREKNPKFIKMDKKALKKAYGQLSDEDVKKKNMKHLGVYKHQNLEVEFLCGRIGELDEDGLVSVEATTVEDFEEAVGVVDMSLILYGSTSHIGPKSLRDQFIEATIGMARDCMVATLPGQQGREAELKETEQSRREDLESGDPCRLEDGEIEYVPAESEDNNKILYATYTRQLLCDVLDGVYASLDSAKEYMALEQQNLDNYNDEAFLLGGMKSDMSSPKSMDSLSTPRSTEPLMHSSSMSLASEDSQGRESLTAKQKALIPEGKNYNVTIALKRNPADISVSWSEAIMNEICKPIARTLEKLPDRLKDLVPKSAVDARYYGVLAKGMAEKSDGPDR